MQVCTTRRVTQGHGAHQDPRASQANKENLVQGAGRGTGATQGSALGSQGPRAHREPEGKSAHQDIPENEDQKVETSTDKLGVSCAARSAQFAHLPEWVGGYACWEMQPSTLNIAVLALPCRAAG